VEYSRRKVFWIYQYAGSLASVGVLIIYVKILKHVFLIYSDSVGNPLSIAYIDIPFPPNQDNPCPY
jgi:hypothetical protein